GERLDRVRYAIAVKWRFLVFDAAIGVKAGEEQRCPGRQPLVKRSNYRVFLLRRIFPAERERLRQLIGGALHQSREIQGREIAAEIPAGPRRDRITIGANRADARNAV